MPTARIDSASGPVELYYEATGAGAPLVWCHEYGGDQDEPCLDPGLFMKRHIPHAGLAVVPMTGHASNLEEPALFNQLVAEFLASVETGRWGTWQRADR